MFGTAIGFLGDVAADVGGTFVRTWPFLAISIAAAAAITTFVGTERLQGVLHRRLWVGIVAAVALATLTPFCSCGTMAVLLGGMAASVPWAPLVAFLVASPLTSPSELVLSAGLFGWPFALVFFVGTIAIGLGAGALTVWIEGTGWLAGQERVSGEKDGCAGGVCPAEPATAVARLGPGAAAVAELAPIRRRPTMADLWREVLEIGRRLLLFFFAFTAVGYLVIEAIPTSWITGHLGGDSVVAVPAAALLGIPAYISTEGSLPLVAALTEGGMGSGAALAFLVTGAGTSIGAISGLLVIARRRVVGLVVGILLASAVVVGWVAEIIL